jgi:hypothetical protein
VTAALALRNDFRGEVAMAAFAQHYETLSDMAGGGGALSNSD